jgi:hypothetical protein
MTLAGHLRVPGGAALLTAGVMALTIAVCASPAGAQPPTASLQQGQVEPGGEVSVTGDGWPAGQVVQAEVCGNGARNGSLDCNRADAVAFGVGADGRFAANLGVRIPPAPCPCVVALTSPGLATRLYLPLEIAGVPLDAINRATDDLPVLAVSDLKLGNAGSPWAALGLDNDRTATVVVRNVGVRPASGTRMVVTIDDQVQVVRILETLPAGATVTVELPIPVPMVSWRSLQAAVTVEVGGSVAESAVRFSAVPWGLVVLVVLVSVAVIGGSLALLARRRRARSQRADLASVVSAAGTPAASGGPEVPPASPTAANDAPAELVGLRVPPAVDDEAMADELAMLLGAALDAVGPVPPGTDMAQLADRVAGAVANELGRRHGLQPLRVASIAGRLRADLAAAFLGDPVAL